MEQTKNKKKIYRMQGFHQRLAWAMNSEIESITQTDLARDVGVSQARVSQLISGVCYPRMPLVQKLAYVLEVSYPWLAFEEAPFANFEAEEYPIEAFWTSQTEKIYYLLWSNRIAERNLVGNIRSVGMALSRGRQLTEACIRAAAEYFGCPRDFLRTKNAKDSMPDFYQNEKDRLVTRFHGFDVESSAINISLPRLFIQTDILFCNKI